MLKGSLVRLRPVESSDTERCWRWMNDKEVTLYLNHGTPVSRAEQQAWVEKVALQTPPPEMTLAIDTLEDRHIGIISLEGIENVNRLAELGIVIGDREYWSRGYGRDAILTLLRFAFNEMNLNRVWLDVHEDNARAIACYRKCGFIEEARLRQHRYKLGRYRDSLIMAVLRHEFAGDHAAS
jgi:RimJ/RimL family protein N-acetyltransferase